MFLRGQSVFCWCVEYSVVAWTHKGMRYFLFTVAAGWGGMLLSCSPETPMPVVDENAVPVVLQRGEETKVLLPPPPQYGLRWVLQEVSPAEGVVEVRFGFSPVADCGPVCGGPPPPSSITFSGKGKGVALVRLAAVSGNGVQNEHTPTTSFVITIR